MHWFCVFADGEAAPPSQKQAPGFSVRLAADLGEFSLFVSGRPAHTWWPDEVSRVDLQAQGPAHP